MGVPANPPPQARLPAKLLNDEELRDYFITQQEDMYRLWLRSGGGTDAVSVIVKDIADLEAEAAVIPSESGVTTIDIDALAQIEDLIPVVIPAVFYSAVKSGNYTSVNGDFIEAQNGATITLDPEADIDDQVMIANGDGTKITVIGKIKYTRLDSSIIIRQQGTSLHFQNFGDYWRIR